MNTNFIVSHVLTVLALVCPLIRVLPALAEDTPFTTINAQGPIELILNNHRFQPAEIVAPTREKIQLLVKNQGGTADEFDPSALKVEKVIGGKNDGIVGIRALDPGRYPLSESFTPIPPKGCSLPASSCAAAYCLESGIGVISSQAECH